MAVFLNLHKFHHYFGCPVATQYCNFKKKGERNESWMAFHPDEQHTSIRRLLLSVEENIEQFIHNWTPPRRISDENIDLGLLYPVYVIRRDLYEATLNNGNLILKKKNHLLLSKRIFHFEEQMEKTYNIDVVTEDYFPKYLSLVQREAERIARKIRRNKDLLYTSIGKIVKEIRSLRKFNERRKWPVT